jgi:hypothetical protein
MQDQHVTPPPSFPNQPLTPPLTVRKTSAEALRVIALFRQIQAAKNINQDTWIEFQLAQGEYDQIQSTLQQDSGLLGFVKDKIK